MTPKELAEIEGRLKAATPGPWQTREGDPSTVETTASALEPQQREVCDTGFRDSPGGVKECRANARFIAHAPDDVARLLAEVRRLTPAVKVARWEAGVDDYEDCTVLRDPATNAVLGWYNRFGFGECIWAQHLFPGAKRKVADLATKNGWEVRDGE